MKQLMDAHSPRVDQLALAELIARGDWDRHIRRVRGVYRARRDQLTESLARRLPGLEVSGVTAGLHVTVRFPPAIDDSAVAAEARRLGVEVIPLSSLALEPSAAGGILIGYGHTHETAVDPAVELVARAVAAHAGGTSR